MRARIHLYVYLAFAALALLGCTSCTDSKHPPPGPTNEFYNPPGREGGLADNATSADGGPASTSTSPSSISPVSTADAANEDWATTGCPPSKVGKTYDVGDGKGLATIGAVPWARLQPGDTVRIFWRKEPYREKFLISQSGNSKHPLRVCGVPGPNGEQPIIDGENAVTDPSIQYNHAEIARRGLISIGLRKDGQDWGDKPRYILVEGLETRNGAAPLSFKMSSGEVKTYLDNASCFFILAAEHITLRNNNVHGCGNGIFVASADSEEVMGRDLLIEKSHIWGNGSVGKNFFQHGIYTEVEGIVVQENWFGPMRDASQGNQLKDRSVGTVVRYNFFEGGSRAMDLVEPEESYPMVKDKPSLHQTHVYGNIIMLGAKASSRPIHYGGDNGNEKSYRKGTLFFYDNTIYVNQNEKDSYYMGLIQLQTNDESADIRNNILLSVGSTKVSWLYEAGTGKLGTNWASSNVSPTVDPKSIKVTAKLEMLPGGKTITGDAPGFVNAEGGDFCLTPTSPARNAAADLPPLPAQLLPTRQYKKHQASVERPSDRKDLGALICK